MIPAPTQQDNKSMFSGEQSPFMAEVQPPVPLGCEVLMHGEVMATRSLCVLTYKVQMPHLLGK